MGVLENERWKAKGGRKCAYDDHTLPSLVNRGRGNRYNVCDPLGLVSDVDLIERKANDCKA